MKVFEIDGGNGGYIEFEDGTYMDSVAGDSYRAKGTIVPETESVSELVKWANEQNLEWVNEPPASSEWDAHQLEEYVGA